MAVSGAKTSVAYRPRPRLGGADGLPHWPAPLTVGSIFTRLGKSLPNQLAMRSTTAKTTATATPCVVVLHVRDAKDAVRVCQPNGNHGSDQASASRAIGCSNAWSIEQVEAVMESSKCLGHRCRVGRHAAWFGTSSSKRSPNDWRASSKS